MPHATNAHRQTLPLQNPNPGAGRPTRLWLASSALLASLVGACAQMPAGTAAAPAQPIAALGAAAPQAGAVASTAASTAASGTDTAAKPAAVSSAPARPVDATAPKPFAEVIKDAKEQKGFVTLWRKDEKTWIEIGPEQFNKPFLLGVNISNSVGERGLYASQMGPGWMVEWRKVGNQVQLLALNHAFRASSDKAMQTVVGQSFSPSLLASGAIASGAHPQRKSVLVDAALLLADLPNYGYAAESAFRLAYALDKTNSAFVSTSAEPDQTVISANMHFSVARLPLPPTAPPAAGASPVPTPTPPRSVPDGRSFFVGFVYSLSRLPEQPMAPRLADPRIGHFATSYTDVSDDFKPGNRVHMVNRWRLEKKDASAALSEPKQPITYWIDKNVPERYRKSVELGILEWNKAFEAIGFLNAIQAKQQPEDASWDNMDNSHASIRWFTGSDVGFAIGPSRRDPRTGEILDADIGMSDVFGRGSRRFISDDAPNRAGAPEAARPSLAQVMARVSGSNAIGAEHAGHDHSLGACSYAAESASEMQFAMDILEARGDLDPASPEAEAFVQAVIKDTITHEVGHTLGFKHNFKASTTVSRADLQKPGLISGSVMDYNPLNLPLKGEPKGDYNQRGLGAYDYWAVAYAYSEFAPADEAAGLRKIAARSTEPALAYADDADAGGTTEGLDPLANRFDSGDDPLAYYAKRLKLSQELWARLATKTPVASDDPLRVRRSLVAGFAQLARASDLVTKYLGGMHVVRDLPGSTGRKTYTPVDPAKQREALGFLTAALFDPKSFDFSPELLASLGVDFNEWERTTPFSVQSSVGAIQTAVLERVMGAGTASRLLELPNFVPVAQRGSIISLNEVYATLQNAIWADLTSGVDTDRLRRNLQREHLKRLVAALTRSGSLPADAQSLMRLNARQLLASLSAANARSSKLGVESRAHLSDSLETLTEALKATMSRSG